MTMDGSLARLGGIADLHLPTSWTDLMRGSREAVLRAAKHELAPRIGDGPVSFINGPDNLPVGIHWTSGKALPDARKFEVTPIIRDATVSLARGRMVIEIGVGGQYGDAFGINASLVIEILPRIEPRAGALPSVVLAIPTRFVRNCDVWVNGWVYAAGVFQPHLLAIAIAADAAAGGVIADAINNSVRALLGSEIQIRLL